MSESRSTPPYSFSISCMRCYTRKTYICPSALLAHSLLQLLILLTSPTYIYVEESSSSAMSSRKLPGLNSGLDFVPSPVDPHTANRCQWVSKCSVCGQQVVHHVQYTYVPWKSKLLDQAIPFGTRRRSNCTTMIVCGVMQSVGCRKYFRVL